MRPIRAFLASIFEYTDVSFTPFTVANKAPIDSTDAKFKKNNKDSQLYILQIILIQYNYLLEVS